MCVFLVPIAKQLGNIGKEINYVRKKCECHISLDS